MDFTSYQLTSSNSASLNTASYFNSTEYAMFVRGATTDLWYAYSVNDVLEVGVWDRNQNLIGWKTLNQSKSFNDLNLSYLNTLNFPITYSFRELNSDFIQFKNEKLLVNPIEQLSSSFQIQSGSFFLTYNMTREMAGSPSNPLVIKEVSPSRKELKLYPISASDLSYESFCEKKVLLRDVSPLYLSSLKSCPYSQIYAQVSPLYQPQIATLKNVFFLNTDAAVITFLKNLYEDLVIYTTTPIVTALGIVSGSVTTNLTRVQGIQTYFTNFLLSHADTISDFADIDSNFFVFASASIERKFAPIGPNPSKEYVDAKVFVYDFFTKYFYVPISTLLSTTYHEKYYGHFRNAVNVGNNRLLQIVNTDMMDERTSPTDPLTLLVKLQSELPADLPEQTPCWVSNISLIPFIVSAIVKSPTSTITHKIGPPNFSAPIPDISVTNVNKAYTSDDLKNTDAVERDLTISRNINELSVDYTNFSNFVVFSSAELRLKIFKNKVINLAGFSSSLMTLDAKNVQFVFASGSLYPFYEQEYANIQNQMTDVVNSFDGYESWLYHGGDYAYTNGNFVSASHVAAMDVSASVYDKTNLDSLINNCPEHILVDNRNDDYIIFLSMIGHFFDNLFIYISNLPSTRQVGNSATEEFTRRIVDYMLQTFGWSLDDSLEQASLVNNYLTSEQQTGLNSMSAEDRLKAVRNRLLINLPQIYKTKGTEESIRLILACYGIPSALLSIREYGGINYSDNTAAYTTYERTYLRQWDTSSKYDNYAVQCPTGSYSFLCKISLDDPTSYVYNSEQILFGRVPDGVTRQEQSGSGEWAVGFVRIEKKNAGKLFFRIGYKGAEQLKIFSPEFPLFDGGIYSVMLRRNFPDAGFESLVNYDVVPALYELYVQKNEGGTQILRLSASAVSYNTSSNVLFTNGGTINLIGWFADQNGQGYTGVFDKFQIWGAPLLDGNFIDYVNNINGYSFSGSLLPHQALYFRMHTDYPWDQLQTPIWKNANPFYATGSPGRLAGLSIPYWPLTTYGNVDYMISTNAWSGSQIPSSQSCSPSQSVYPWQFKVVDYPSTWGVSRYGPNRFRNEKVRQLSQSVEARFDDKARSTFVDPLEMAPDSNQIGFFADPQDFKNKDIVRHFGNYDFMDAIGDPANQFSQSYSALKVARQEYSEGYNEYSGSKTLFNELMILYKLYFNRSVFEAIKNVVPARTNTLAGVLIEPTILERPKYQSKPLFTEANSGSVFYADVTASHYFRDPNTKLVRLTESIDFGLSTSLDETYLNLPNRIYPVNYGGNVIGDMPDKFELGAFAGGFERGGVGGAGALGVPLADFIGSPLVANAGSQVLFTNLSLNASTYMWDFGNGNTSSDPNPVNLYPAAGLYNVTLTATSVDDLSDTETKNSYVQILAAPIIPITVDFTGIPLTGNVPLTITFTNMSTGATSYAWDFGDGGTSTDVNPTHTYTSPGTYNVTLVGSNSGGSVSAVKNAYVTTALNAVPCNTIIWYAGDNWPREDTINLGSGTGLVYLFFNTYGVPAKFEVFINGGLVAATGYRGDGGYQYILALALAAKGAPFEWIIGPNAGYVFFSKTTSYPYAIVKTWSPIVSAIGFHELLCPI